MSQPAESYPFIGDCVFDPEQSKPSLTAPRRWIRGIRIHGRAPAVRAKMVRQDGWQMLVTCEADLGLLLLPRSQLPTGKTLAYRRFDSPTIPQVRKKDRVVPVGETAAGSPDTCILTQEICIFSGNSKITNGIAIIRKGFQADSCAHRAS